MNVLVFLIGITLPLLLGWISLLLLEKKHPVLGRSERWLWALVLGPTFFALLAFCSHVLGLTKLNLLGLLAPLAFMLALLIGLAIRTHAFGIRKTRIAYAPSIPLSRFFTILIILLIIWTGVKIAAGVYDLISVPTYWDDSFNNWNMRGKIFFVTQELKLEIPIGNGLIQSSEGVSSYPPALPLLKTWLSVLRGSWEEPLVNGLHVIWLIGLLGSFYFALRRKLSPMLSLGGIYLLVSLPLLLVQATNPYADIFMALHILLAVLCVYRLSEAKEAGESASWLKLSGFVLGLTLFTKNEASVLYVPILTILLAWVMYAKTINRAGVRPAVLIAACIGAPWLLFKWTHGLSFGNAKSVGGMQIAFHSVVLQAIWYHLSHEPNWLLLPLVLPLTILMSGKRAFRLPEGVLTIFVLSVITAQFLIFTFTPLATEAILQTGLSRGLLHIAPVALLLVILLGTKLFRDQK